ncbi:MAG TPA: ankyrin repeat domain-containing protein, partial [Chitinophagaceae bacterium]|nr:ankyrin repeat domain-containing protein [Chitinophagaceae bacterium]
MRPLSILLSAFAYLSMTHATPQSSNPLFRAVKNDDIKEVRRLLDVGADANSFDEDSDHLLMNAALYSSVDIMQLLIERGSKVNATNKLGETALMWAANDPDKIKLLLKYGADINVKAKSGNSPLLIACVGYGKYDVVKLLIEKGADVFAVNNWKENALMRAALFGDTATISLLLDKGIEIDAMSQDSVTALMN